MREEEGRRRGDEESWRRGDEESWRRGGDEEFAWRRRGGPRGHVRGPGFPGRPGFPGGPHFGGPGRWLGESRITPGPRAKRGALRAAALGLLAEGPMHGYPIIQAVGERR